jgi:hypothetical protein
VPVIVRSGPGRRDDLRRLADAQIAHRSFRHVGADDELVERGNDQQRLAAVGPDLLTGEDVALDDRRRCAAP